MESSGDAPVEKHPALKNLKKALAAESHLFTCGGAIPIRKQVALQSKAEENTEENTEENIEEDIEDDSDEDSEEDNEKSEKEKIESNPITIRWDAKEDSSPSSSSVCPKITLPLEPGSEQDLERLVQHSSPATFGRDGKDVYDEDYRKALKMDASAFCSTFNPYELGIVDEITQLLLPKTEHLPTDRAVRTELYKLNVYSGPSGKFKAHVDTPRSPSQFGSLVVCLPVDHEGGQLQVRHKGEEMTFDWSTSKREGGPGANIYWAAFYSDCEHEILEVTSGHRVTLTYNLYAVRGAGRLAGLCPTLNATSLPLFPAIEAMVKEDPFNGKGGKVGFFCSHAYAYTVREAMHLPDTLKGLDMAIWESFWALGLEPRVVPVLQLNEFAHQSFLEEYVRKNPRPPRSDTQARAHWKAQLPPAFRVGQRFALHIDNGCEIDTSDGMRWVCDNWSRGNGPRKQDGIEDSKNIRWLTKPSHHEIQLIYTAYGNDASADSMYSHCAILVNIPPEGERRKGYENGCR